MDIGRAITFFTEDEQWIQKVGIGIGVILISMLLSPLLIGFLGFFILGGYSVRLLQNVRDGRQQPLPDWDQWGGDLARGFKYVLVTLVWSLAAYLMMVPMVIGGALADSGGAGEFIGSAIMICTSCLLMLYGIFVALAAPGFTISFAHDERISSGLKITKIWQWTQANLGQVIIVMLVVMAVSFIVSMLAGIVGLILCLIGTAVTIPFSIFFLSIFQYNLYGQLAREYPMYDGPGAVPAPLPPTEPDAMAVVASDTDAATAESPVIIPPAPVDEAGADETSADSVDGMSVAVDEVDEAAGVAGVDVDVVDATKAADEVEVIATEVSETGDEITASVDDIVEAGADVAEDAADAVVGDADAGDDDLDPDPKPEA